jgi:hypothetical protein
MAAAGGPPIVPVRPLPGGAVGAWEVVRPNGASSVLTWRAPRPGRDTAADVARTAVLVEAARRVGVPAPAYEDVVPLGDGGVVVLQELVAGVRPTLNVDVITSLLELTDRRRGVLKGTRYEHECTRLYLIDDGPGFCLHGPLRDHDRRTRRLLDWIEAVGRSEGDTVAGDDLVHFDYHFGNVLIDPRDPSRVVAILDWDGARSGDVGIDDVNLALDLVLYNAEPTLVDQIADHLAQTTTENARRAYWAHGLLKLVDWRLRHSPEDDLNWLPRAEALAGM